MKIIFAGPSLYGVDLDLSDVVLRGPAEMGDIARAVRHGARTIGLIDGHFGQSQSVWHKEILAALEQGVVVFGAASMGALRAAECEMFGMVPVGDIAKRYCSGALIDDADVALINGPAELGYPPLSEPMVDVIATITGLLHARLIDFDEARAIESAARHCFFADRTRDELFRGAELGLRRDIVAKLYSSFHVSQKTLDALELVERVKRSNGSLVRGQWRLAATPFWLDAMGISSSAVTQP